VHFVALVSCIWYHKFCSCCPKINIL